MDRCGCETGGDCTSISVCAAESMVEDAVEELQSRIEELEAELQGAINCTNQQEDDKFKLDVENEELQSRIEAGLKLADEVFDKEWDTRDGDPPVDVAALAYKLREALGDG